MIIRVGSLNPVKLGAIRTVIAVRFPEPISCPWPWTPGSQSSPIGLDETLPGARGRAREAFADCDLCVALESGLIPVPQTAAPAT